jgi:hypothetical protein
VSFLRIVLVPYYLAKLALLRVRLYFVERRIADDAP